VAFPAISTRAFGYPIPEELLAAGHKGGLRFCHATWKQQQLNLMGRYGIEWKTLVSRNPFIRLG
jgi:hypothetical protein